MFDHIRGRLKGLTAFLIFFLLFSAIIILTIHLNYHFGLISIKQNFTSEDILSVCVLVYFVIIFFAGSVVLTKQSKIKNTVVHYKNFFLCLPGFLLISAGLALYTNFALSPSDQVKNDLNQSFLHRNQSNAIFDMTKIQESMQIKWRFFHQCCGFNGPQDYGDLETDDQVFLSCCPSYVYDCGLNNAYKRGCFEVYLINFRNLKSTLLIFLAGSCIALLITIVMMVAFYLSFRKGVIARNKRAAAESANK